MCKEKMGRRRVTKVKERKKDKYKRRSEQVGEVRGGTMKRKKLHKM
jgi:hypothetical protein